MAFPKKKAPAATAADMVKKSKSGKGTLSFTPKKGEDTPMMKKGGFVPFKKKGKK